MRALHYRLMALPLAAMLSSCTTPYQEPAGSSLASIEFVNDTAEVMGMQLYLDSTECTNRKSAGFVDPRRARKVSILGRQNLGITVIMDANRRTLPIALNGPMAGAIISHSEEACHPTINFAPQVGHAYVFKARSDGKTCTFQFFERPSANQRPDEEVAVEYTRRIWTKPMTESGAWCKKQ